MPPFGRDRRQAPAPSGVEALLTRLRSDDDAVRFAALDDLRRLRTGPLSAEDGSALLRGAASKFPSHKFKSTDIPSELVSVLMSRSPAPDASWTRPVIELYESYTDGARRNALSLFAATGTTEAMESYVRVLQKHGPPKASPRLASPHVSRKPLHGHVLFPALIEIAARHDVSSEMLSIALAYIKAGAYPDAAREDLSRYLRQRWAICEPRVAEVHGRPSLLWSDEYSAVRSEAGLLLDISGRVPSTGSRAILKDAFSAGDPRLVMFAVIGALRLSLDPPDAAVFFAASRPEPRYWLFVELKALGRLDLFPSEFLNQHSFAEAELAQWLSFPTELGREPDEMEEMGTVEMPLEDGQVADLHVLRFRTVGDDWSAAKGWLAGVAGPYKRVDQPTLPGLGATFSRFEEWELHDVAGHAEANVGTVSEWAAARGTSTQ